MRPQCAAICETFDLIRVTMSRSGFCGSFVEGIGREMPRMTTHSQSRQCKPMRWLTKLSV